MMSTDYDPRAEIETAMAMAATATCELERIKWVRIALAWQDLARGHPLIAQAPARCAEIEARMLFACAARR